MKLFDEVADDRNFYRAKIYVQLNIDLYVHFNRIYRRFHSMNFQINNEQNVFYDFVRFYTSTMLVDPISPGTGVDGVCQPL